MIRNLVVLLVIVGAGYWYWSSLGPESRRAAQQQHLEENDHRMQRCVKQEESMNAVGGLGGTGGIAGGAEEFCAKKLGLYLAEGHWLEQDADDNYAGD